MERATVTHEKDIFGSVDNFFKAMLIRVWGHSQQDPPAILSWAQFAVKHMEKGKFICLRKQQMGKQ